VGWVGVVVCLGCSAVVAWGWAWGGVVAVVGCRWSVLGGGWRLGGLGRFFGVVGCRGFLRFFRVGLLGLGILVVGVSARRGCVSIGPGWGLLGWSGGLVCRGFSGGLLGVSLWFRWFRGVAGARGLQSVGVGCCGWGRWRVGGVLVGAGSGGEVRCGGWAVVRLRWGVGGGCVLGWARCGARRGVCGGLGSLLGVGVRWAGGGCGGGGRGAGGVRWVGWGGVGAGCRRSACRVGWSWVVGGWVCVGVLVFFLGVWAAGGGGGGCAVWFVLAAAAGFGARRGVWLGCWLSLAVGGGFVVRWGGAGLSVGFGLCGGGWVVVFWVLLCGRGFVRGARGGLLVIVVLAWFSGGERVGVRGGSGGLWWPVMVVPLLGCGGCWGAVWLWGPAGGVGGRSCCLGPGRGRACGRLGGAPSVRGGGAGGGGGAWGGGGVSLGAGGGAARACGDHLWRV